MPDRTRTAVLIPALNEERSIGLVLNAIPARYQTRVVVVDNGSTDRTAEVARAQGAHVVSESGRGYGAACLRGLAELSQDPPDIVVFLDGDFSDHPEEMDRLVKPIQDRRADFVVGSRARGEREPGALTPHARFGNALATFLLRVLYGVRFTDLGPFRAITWKALTALKMEDRDFGWTVEMQIKAAQQGIPSLEVPVSYRRRTGASKISGTLRGSFLAGKKILQWIFLARIRRPQS